MASFWMIDGFNVMRQSQQLAILESKHFEAALQQFVQRLKAFAEFSQETIICVLDATQSVRNYRQEEHHGKVTVLYSRSAESADEVLIELAATYKEKCIIVTSDKEILQKIKPFKASSLSSQSFNQILARLNFLEDREIEEKKPISHRHLTQKKGPARRTAKKDRKVSSKLKHIFSS